jgi:hypothetical protein
MRHFTIILGVCILVIVLFSYTLFTLCPFETKRGSFFFVSDRECISKPVKCFLSQNGQTGSLLVFYIGSILVDKNTLCNGCFLTRLSVLFRVFK